MEARKRSRLLIQVSHVLLPDDVIVDILSWLPVKSSLRFKSVCKSSNIIIQQRFFIEKHQRQSKSQVAYEYVFESYGENYIYLAYSNDLALEKMAGHLGEYRIRNPATKQVLHVVWSVGYGFILGFNSSTSKYNLIRVHSNEGRPDLDISVLTFGYDDDDAWSLKRYLDINLMSGGNISICCTCNNDLFYIVSFCYDELSKSDIIRSTFDGKNAMNIKFPQNQSFLSSEVTLFQAIIDHDHGKLSIRFIFEQEIHMWMLDNYSEHIWSEKKIIPLDFMNDYSDPDSITVLHYWPSKSQMHISIDNHLLQYDIHSKMSTCLGETPPGETVLYQLVPSLVFLKGMHSEDFLNLSL